jgi:hypothetical protein
MEFPTLAEVETADHEQICRWYRFLPPAGANHAEKSPEEFEAAFNIESKIQTRVYERWIEGGGFTPELSKKIGWNP